MKVFVVMYMFGAIGATVGPLGDKDYTNKEDVDYMMSFCEDYRITKLEPEIDKGFSDPKKFAKLKSNFPNIERSDILYKCEIHDKHPEHGSEDQLMGRLKK